MMKSDRISLQCFGSSIYPTEASSILDIAERSGIPFQSIRSAADVLENFNLIKKKDEQKA